MDGLINFTVYLDPVNNYKFIVIEGNGRYFSIRNETQEMLLSGDFHIPPQRFRITSLSEGCLPMEINLYLTRIPGKTTYYNKVVVRYDLLMDTSRADQQVYSLDYDAIHYAFMDMDGDGIYDPINEKFGELKMNGTFHPAKLIDISGLEAIKRYNLSKVDRSATIVAGNESQRKCIVWNPVVTQPGYKEDE
jgi:hypothetical protein